MEIKYRYIYRYNLFFRFFVEFLSFFLSFFFYETFYWISRETVSTVYSLVIFTTISYINFEMNADRNDE